MGEAGACVVELDNPSGLELAAEVEEELRDLGPPVELGLDPRERAATIPESTVLAGAAIRVALGDEFDRAELAVLEPSLHGLTVPEPSPAPIGVRADPAAGTYGA